jgi:parallel beta-helix repeat protein
MRNRMERNVVLCEYRLRGAPGVRVGLSLGGGSTGSRFCREGDCFFEQQDSVISDNLIAFCSDEGIYLNRAARSIVDRNTLIDTAGITVRFAQSSADVRGNLVDGIIRSRDNGLLRAEDNETTWVGWLFLGRHGVRDLFVAPETLDFLWRNEPPRRDSASEEPLDLCNGKRDVQPAYGAFESFCKCSPLAP